MSEDDKVKPLPVKFKKRPDDDVMLKLVHTTFVKDECNHRTYVENNGIRSVQYLIREGETEVECSHCNAKLDPMFVLKILATEENRWNETRKNYQAEMKILKERKRTKCDACGHMTRIRT